MNLGEIFSEKFKKIKWRRVRLKGGEIEDTGVLYLGKDWDKLKGGLIPKEEIKTIEYLKITLDDKKKSATFVFRVS